jgi:hypothetical protein
MAAALAVVAPDPLHFLVRTNFNGEHLTSAHLASSGRRRHGALRAFGFLYHVNLRFIERLAFK